MNGGVWGEGLAAEMEGGGREVSGASHCDMEPLKGLWREVISRAGLFPNPSSPPPPPLPLVLSLELTLITSSLGLHI